jgi:hypothetical protein
VVSEPSATCPLAALAEAGRDRGPGCRRADPSLPKVFADGRATSASQTMLNNAAVAALYGEREQRVAIRFASRAGTMSPCCAHRLAHRVATRPNGPRELDWPRFLPKTPLTHYGLDKETLAALQGLRLTSVMMSELAIPVCPGAHERK